MTNLLQSSCIMLNKIPSSEFYRPTTVDVIPYLARERWIHCFSFKKC